MCASLVTSAVMVCDGSWAGGPPAALHVVAASRGGQLRV
jgi:hypothetical protein